MTLTGTPRAASMVGTIPVGVVLPREPKVSGCAEAFNSSKLLMPVLDLTYIIELTAPGLPIQVNLVGSNVTPGLFTMPSTNQERPGTASVSPSGGTRRSR